jgi:hypothetical protein
MVAAPPAGGAAGAAAGSGAGGAAASAAAWMDPARSHEPDRRGVLELPDGCRLAWWAYVPGLSAGGAGGDADEAAAGASSASDASSDRGGNSSPEMHCQLPPPPPRLLVVWGAFATARHFDDVAAWLRDAGGVEVLAYHHRGVAA